MKVQTVKSWEGFEEELKRLTAEHARRADPDTYVSKMLFRGQSDSKWLLTTTLERYAPKLTQLTAYYDRIHRARPLIEASTGCIWDIPEPGEYERWVTNKLGREPLAKMPGGEYLAYLRQHGFPSPLLDWSRSPYVAAFFAFNQARSCSGLVSIYAFVEDPGIGKAGWSADPKIASFGPDLRTHRRHIIQQSEYTVCTVQPPSGTVNLARYYPVVGQNNEHRDQDLVWQINIPVTEKRKVLNYLDRFNLNAFSLFGSEESLMETAAFRELDDIM
jgi:hypothetical protein